LSIRATAAGFSPSATFRAVARLGRRPRLFSSCCHCVFDNTRTVRKKPYVIRLFALPSPASAAPHAARESRGPAGRLYQDRGTRSAAARRGVRGPDSILANAPILAQRRTRVRWSIAFPHTWSALATVPHTVVNDHTTIEHQDGGRNAARRTGSEPFQWHRPRKTVLWPSSGRGFAQRSDGGTGSTSGAD
jgi:hypothetical protein